MNSKLRFYKVRDVQSPERGTAKSAGIDFFVPNDFTTVHLKPGEDVLIPSGIKVGLPENTMLMGADKSGIASSNFAKERARIHTKNADWWSSVIVGAKIIDEDYPGELHIHLINVGNMQIAIKPGMKIAQFIVVPVLFSELEEVTTTEDLNVAKTTRSGGFSSTGV